MQETGADSAADFSCFMASAWVSWMFRVLCDCPFPVLGNVKPSFLCRSTGFLASA